MSGSGRRRKRRRSPLSEFGRLPEIAPYHACIRCLRGDVERGFLVQGDGD